MAHADDGGRKVHTRTTAQGDDDPGSGEARIPSMSPLKRLNGAMLVGLACALLLIYHIWEWWFSQDISTRDKMFATIIFISTVGVMCWFSGDNASRDLAYIQTVHAEHVEIGKRQISARIQVAELLEEVQLNRGAQRAEMEHLKDLVERLLKSVEGDRRQRAVQEETRAREFGALLKALERAPDEVRAAVSQAKAEGYLNGVRGRLVRRVLPEDPDPQD